MGDARPAGQRADERTHRVMRAAMHLLNTMPYEDIMVEHIAIAAGMSRPLLYHYYGGKERVMAGALRWCGNRMLGKVGRAAGRAGSGWLRAGLAAYLDFGTDHTLAAVTLARRAYLPEAVESVRLDIRQRIFRYVSGRLAPDGDSLLLRSLLWGWFGQVDSMCHEWMIHREPDREFLETLLCDLLLAGLTAGAAHDAATAQARRTLAESLNS